MPDGPATRNRLADRSLQPVRTVAAAPNGGTAGAVVFVTLTFSGGRAALPEDIFDALEAKYGAGKVVSELQSSPGNLNLRITA